MQGHKPGGTSQAANAYPNQGDDRMKVVFDDAQSGHYPRHFLVNGSQQTNPEVPERGRVLLQAARAVGLEAEAPVDHGNAPMAAVHTAEYLQFLEDIVPRWRRIEGASEEVVPNVHPRARDDGYPASAVGQAGYHMADTACPLSEGSWPSIRASANTAAHAASLLLAGEREVYALCRPPGHHAFRDMAGGFCYVNNAAVAAERLQRGIGPVAVLDVDLHHGNGTQDVFYRRDDVLTVSLHADPVRFYPFFWGHAAERGEGDGLGFNLNLPLPRRTADDEYLAALRAALRRIRSFAPEALVIALGLDAYEGDPLAGLAITTDGFRRVARAIGELDLPTAIVQEGGYLSAALGDNLASFLDGFREAR